MRFLLSADALLMSGGRAGFYAGGGLSLFALSDFRLVHAGPHLSLGGDIPVSERGGVVIDSHLGFYPFLLLERLEPGGSGPVIPVFFRLGVGYRWTF